MSISNLGSEQPINLCVIVVLYNRAINTSSTCRSLLSQSFTEPLDVFIVYDNSPSSKPGEPTPRGWEVVLDPSNGGLVIAYSHAVSRAKEKGCHWILLLDQDTDLPADFLVAVHKDLALLHPKTEVVAIVPIVEAAGRQVSPMMPRLGRELPFNMRCVVESKWLWAINSGTCLRVDFIDGVGGFPKTFWLDYLDHWLFKTISNSGKRVYVSGMVLQHELSVSNMNNGVSVQRYKNVLAAERAFTNNYLPPLWRYILVPRLLARASKHLVMTRDKRLGFSMIASAAAQISSLFRK